MMTGTQKRLAALFVAIAVSPFGSPAALAKKKPKEPEPTSTTQTSENEVFTEWGRSSRTIVPPTHLGVWDGTWFYVNRDFIIAVWIKTEKGKPKVKLQYRSRASTEGFQTDWNGNADYKFRDATATFALNMKRRDENLIEGRWDWVLDVGAAARIQEGDYRMYRSGDGRFFVLEFLNFTRRIQRSGGDEVLQGDPSWTFTKVSKRLVLWDELPF